jgi:hypothetical protein
VSCLDSHAGFMEMLTGDSSLNSHACILECSPETPYILRTPHSSPFGRGVPNGFQENKRKYANEGEEVSMATLKKRRAFGDDNDDDGDSSSSEEEVSSEEKPAR